MNVGLKLKSWFRFSSCQFIWLLSGIRNDHVAAACLPNGGCQHPGGGRTAPAGRDALGASAKDGAGAGRECGGLRRAERHAGRVRDYHVAGTRGSGEFLATKGGATDPLSFEWE